MKRETTHPITRALVPILEGICREASKLNVVEAIDASTGGILIKVTAGKDDYRILVGRAGRSIHSIQRLVARAGEVSGIQANLDLLTDNVGQGVAIHHFTPNANFDVPKLMELLCNVCDIVRLPYPLEIRNNNGKCKVVIPAADLTDRATVEDMDNFCYAYGMTNGRRIEIKPT